MSSRPAHGRPVAALASLALTAALFVVVPATSASAADPCTTGGNAIACENSKPGADPSEWDIDGAGDEGLQGFATDISVNVGSTIGFKIKTAARAYSIDIYRTGYYGGLGARKIASVTPSATLPQTQPQCVTDAATELYDCGNWAVSASWAVPATAVSGVYIAHLHDPVTNDESHITFVVRNDASTSAVVFQTSDPTWHAYNTYGGSDFYQGAANGRSYKISYNRPFATRNGVTSRDFYFSAEYAMVRFLERNGYDISYIAGVDSDRYGSLIKKHKVFLSVGHDEYWSAAQRANVEAARDAGVNLAFVSGNEVYWRTRYENSVAGPSTSYRTLVSYKETWSNGKIDPSNQWTGTWRDPRFAAPSQGGNLPENGLTGTAYSVQGHDLPVTVSSGEGKYRLWRNTSLTSLSPGATQALAEHTVGYESDEDYLNDARPQGLIRLSTTTGYAYERLVDWGNTTVRDSTTTHHLTLYRAASGALVFGAGTVQWAWGLDQTHDGDGAPADSRMQQATVNLLADMNAQPGTLMSGLSAASRSTDTQAPQATIVSPAASTVVPSGTQVTVTGTASDLGGGSVAGVEVSTDGGTRWKPATGTTSWSYTYVQSGQGAWPIKARAIDDSANIGAPTTRQLQVSCPCSLFGPATPSTVATDGSPLEFGLRFTPTIDGFVRGVRFYKGAGNSGTHSGSLWSAAGIRLATVTFTGETAVGWQTATFSTPVSVTTGTAYVVSYTAPQGHYAYALGAFEAAGVSAYPLSVAGGFGATPAGTYGQPGAFPTQSFGSSHYFVDPVFTTVDDTPLTVGQVSPLASATSVPASTPLRATFVKPVEPTSVSMSVTPSGGSAIAGTTTYDQTTKTATFAPSAPLALGTTYAVHVVAQDLQGKPLQGGGDWSFTTVLPPQTSGVCPCSLFDDSTTPETLDVPDQNAVTVGVRFSSTRPGSVTALRFYKAPGNTGTHVGTLWTTDGQVVARGTFTDEGSTGWQTLTLSQPAAIARDVEYVASYRTTVGHYSATIGGLSAADASRLPLRTPAGGAGVYSYADAAPTNRSATNYLVDVVFKPSADPLVLTAGVPLAGDPGTALDSSISAAFSVPLAAGAGLRLSAGGQDVAGTTSTSADRRRLTFATAAPLTTATTYTVTAHHLVSVDGATSPDITWSFTTAGADGCPCTMFGTEVPGAPSVDDPAQVELGVAFTPTADGAVTGVRFYKGPGNGGVHTGSLWSATGQRLATATFTAETDSGWQTALFPSAVQVEPGVTYVASYLAPQGHYGATSSYFASPRVRGPLTAPAGNNGRYVYGGGFPTGSWGSTNYFVDALFVKTAPALPVVTSTIPSAGAAGVPSSGAVSAVLSKVPASGTPTLTLRVGGATVTGNSVFDPATRRVTMTPAAPIPAGVAVTVEVSLGGVPLAGGSWTFTTAAAVASGVSLWQDSEIPTLLSIGNSTAVQVGTRFAASTPGRVVAIRFYKGLGSDGQHTVNLWGPDGSLVASAPSSAESAAGWQVVPLPSPAVLEPGQTYVAAVHAADGLYSATVGELGAARVRGVLSTPPTGGAYVYGTGLPAAFSSAGYGVDVVFVPGE
jgi:hypothetical protein